ncbi:hypothetical protein MTO96_029759 [Rhipicephalus appendiculatus]
MNGDQESCHRLVRPDPEHPEARCDARARVASPLQSGCQSFTCTKKKRHALSACECSNKPASDTRGRQPNRVPHSRLVLQFACFWSPCHCPGADGLHHCKVSYLSSPFA